MVHFIYREFCLESSVGEINSTNCTKLHARCGRLPCHDLPNMPAENVRYITFQWLRWIILRNMTRESVPIDQQITNFLQQQIEWHCKILKSLFTTIIFGGRNNIALMQRSTRWWSTKFQSFWKLSGTIRISNWQRRPNTRTSLETCT